MANMKFKVESPDHSRKIQKALYAAGYSWRASKMGDHADATYLYANHETMRITRGEMQSTFDSYDGEEYELSFTFTKADRPFNINGKLMTLQEAKDYIKTFEEK